MEMTPQGTMLYAAAIEHVSGAGRGDTETVTSVGTVVAWQKDPEITEDDRYTVLVPLIAWYDGPAADELDGSITTPAVALVAHHVIAYGGTPHDAATRARRKAAVQLGDWRATDGPEDQRDAGTVSAPERASGTAGRAESADTDHTVVTAFTITETMPWPFPVRFHEPLAFGVEVVITDADGAEHFPPFIQETYLDDGKIYSVDVKNIGTARRGPRPYKVTIRARKTS